MVKIKSKVTSNTQLDETVLLQQVGKYKVVQAADDPTLLKEVITELSNCAKLLHSMAVGGLDNVLYGVASLRRVIQVVHVQIENNMRVVI